MSKTIKSPVKKWPGAVTLHDPLSLPQVVAIKEAFNSALELGSEKNKKGETIITDLSLYHKELAPAITDCVQSWDLEGIDNPPSPFPGTPIKPAAEVINWLSEEVTELFQEAEDPPNE